MRAPNESTPSGKVIQQSLQIAARVKNEPEVQHLSEETFAAREVQKRAMRARNDLEDRTFLADGAVNAAQRRTDYEIVLFGKRLSGALGTVGRPGDNTDAFRYVFAKKAPSMMLPEASEARSKALVDFERRIGNEAEAVFFQAQEKEALLAGRKAEDKARLATVFAVRAMGNAVHAWFASSPSAARRVLGYSNAVVTRRRNAAAAAKIAKADHDTEPVAKAAESEPAS